MLAILLGLIAVACDRPAGTVAALPQSASPDAALGAPTDVRPEEALFQDLARRAPSTAGFFIDETGSVVVRVRDQQEDDLARVAIQELVATRPWLSSGAEPNVRAVKIERAQYTFRQLAIWRDLAFDNALARIPGVHSLDLDEARNRVALGIDPRTFVETRATATERLAAYGVDSQALVFDSVGQHIQDKSFVPPTTIQDQTSDPLAGGLEVRIQQSDGLHRCTLGFVAQRNGTLGLVTASHCTSGTYGPDGNSAFQLNSRLVATESVDPYGYTCGFFSECRGSDAALFATSATAPMSVGLILRTTPSNGGGLTGRLGSINVDQANPYWIVTGEENNDILVGTTVHKSGIATGWTWGTVKQTCVDHYLDGNHLIRCVYEASYVADHGDSGAPVFIRSSTCSRCVLLAGIHNGRGEIGNDQARFSKLSRIKSDLGGSWVVLRGFNLSTPSRRRVHNGCVGEEHQLVLPTLTVPHARPAPLGMTTCLDSAGVLRRLRSE